MDGDLIDAVSAAPAPAPAAPAAPAPAYTPDAKAWLTRIAAAEKYRDNEYLKRWQTNVNYRMQRPFSKDTDEERLALPEDWARTKQKAAQLNYQLPKIVARPKGPAFQKQAPLVTADVNDVLRYECDAAFMMDECLADGINAAGVLVSMIGIDRQTEDYDLEVPLPPITDPMTGAVIPNPAPPTIKRVTKTIAQKFYWDRMSPADFLWPAEFRSSNWDQAPWLGNQKWMLLEQAKKTYKKLPPDFKGTSKRPKSLADDTDALYDASSDYVRVTQIWYYAWLYDPDKGHPHCIRRLVFVEGHPDPVEFDETDWQEWVPETVPQPADPTTGTAAVPGRPGYYKGLNRLPIRVETLAYVSDHAIPPSDSEAGRPQVKEMMRSRSQMLRQRDSSIPVRWYNTNLVDEEVIQQLRQGEYQDFIPVNGSGDRMIGEVARANYPRENFEFQTVIGNDLDRSWALSNNQMSLQNSGERSAREVGVMQSAGQVRLDYEKGRVNRYLVRGAEVLFSLMQKFRAGTKYVTIPSPEGDQQKPVTPLDLQGEFLFDFIADSSDRVDLTTQQNNSIKLYNLLAPSRTVNRAGLERTIIELHGLNPDELTQPEPPAKPEPMNISFRFSGDDMLNPMVVALLTKNGHELTAQDIKAAAMLIQDAVSQVSFRHAQPPPGAPAPPAEAPAPPPGNAPMDKLEAAPAVSPIAKRGASGERLV